MMRARVLFGTLVACALAIACGGATANNLFDAPGEPGSSDLADAAPAADVNGGPHDTLDASSASDGHAKPDGDVGGGHDKDASEIPDTSAPLDVVEIPDSPVAIDA